MWNKAGSYKLHIPSQKSKGLLNAGFPSCLSWSSNLPWRQCTENSFRMLTVTLDWITHPQSCQPKRSPLGSGRPPEASTLPPHPSSSPSLFLPYPSAPALQKQVNRCNAVVRPPLLPSSGRRANYKYADNRVLTGDRKQLTWPKLSALITHARILGIPRGRVVCVPSGSVYGATL